MKIKSVTIENYRAIKALTLPLHPQLTVLHGPNGSGKTSVLNAVAKALSGPYVPPSKLVEGISAEKRTEPAFETDIRDGSDLPTIRLEPEEEHPLLTSYVSEWNGRQLWHHNAMGQHLPFAFYDIDRRIQASFTPARIPEPHHERIGGSQPWRPDYAELWDWFYARENSELRQQRDCRDFELDLPNLTAIREAIEAMVEGASRPRIEFDPLRLVVDINQGGTPQPVSLEQLSEGYRSVLALAADLAWRMANMGEPSDAPLTKAIIVLIDEIELHLHPAWQQRILPDLMRTFPSVQFIVSTHSPQVLTTILPEQIVELAIQDGQVAAGASSGPTFGAEAGEVLSGTMGVNKRPENRFTVLLHDYMRLVGRDQGESQEALDIRKQLDEISFHDPELDRADLEIRRRKVLRKMGGT